jgi:two-component system phosphate regulon sensor histidine kinase PhoR
MTPVIVTICIAVLAAALISLIVASRLNRQIRNIKTALTQFTAGNFTHRAGAAEWRVFGQLTDALNQMAASMAKRINTVTAQRNELEAVFSGMAEGVVVTDDRQRIIAINDAGASLLNVDAQTALGRGIAEIIYNAELLQLVADVLAQKKTLEKDIIIYKDKKRHVQVCGAPVETASGNRAVIVLSDMTRIYQLENVRREFVSNVSHELKTPVTSIKGAVETLLDGVVNNPDEAGKFLEIIARHTNRLNAIIEDILSLSRIEQEIETRSITSEIAPIKEVLAAAAQACQTKAAEKQIQITVDCDQTLSAPINPPLLEQAIVNLIDNAIKYSDPKKIIALAARQSDSQIVITVRDDGCGIGPEHLPRIFERFYVADRARSRKLGGTGLGLAIVKHIINAHNGKVSVESTPGKGSTFTITIPVASV